MEDKPPRYLPDDMSSLTPSEVTVDGKLNFHYSESQI